MSVVREGRDAPVSPSWAAPEPGMPGRGALGKVQFVAAVGREGQRGFGRARWAIIQDVGAPSLRAFLLDNVEPGASVITDGWPSYPAS